VRYCARLALGRLGHGPVAIVPGPQRAPCWPVGYVGSLTHCAGFRAAVVAHSSDLAGLGVDAEPNLSLPLGVEEIVLDSQERRHVAELTSQWRGPHWDRVIFSAKESVYKVWSPLTGRWLNFDEAEVRVSPNTGSFAVQVRAANPGPLATFTGRFAVADGIIGTAVALAHER
jgi:4'-phosphopantetheinyl transferase EntD